MSNFAWYGLQIAIALAVFVLIGETVGVKDRGIAPAVVSMAIAYGVTLLVSMFVDWRKRRSLRRFAVSDELQGSVGSRRRALRHTGNSPELISGTRIGQNPRKLT